MVDSVAIGMGEMGKQVELEDLEHQLMPFSKKKENQLYFIHFVIL